MRIETDDLKVICGSCLEPMECEVKDGIHGAEIVAVTCECNAMGGWDGGFDDGHSEGYQEGLTEGRSEERRKAAREDIAKQECKPVDLSAVTKDGS